MFQPANFNNYMKKKSFKKKDVRLLPVKQRERSYISTACCSALFIYLWMKNDYNQNQNNVYIIAYFIITLLHFFINILFVFPN